MRLKYTLAALTFALAACGDTDDVDVIDDNKSNKAPTAKFSFQTSDTNVSFSNKSSDPEGDTLSYTWSFGDGKSSTSASPSHTYQEGSYKVALTVSDGELTDTTSMSVSITKDSKPLFVGDALRGKELYESTELNCTKCHGASGEGPDKVIDISKYSALPISLSSFINNDMPQTNPTLCQDQCAEDISAYLLTWVDVSTPAQACENNLTYSARQLKLLTREEYQNTLEDLLDIDFDAASIIPSDASIHGYNNNLTAAVTQVHQESYFDAAKQAAAWARKQDFSGSINCAQSNKASCIKDFTSNFAKKAFRRPLSKGEISAFTALFSDSYTDGEVAAGLEMAITAALVSPAFLYRSEQGSPVSIGEHDGSQYEFSGNSTTISAIDFTDKRHYVAGTRSGSVIFGDTTKSKQQGKMGKHLSHTGEGTLMQFTLRGVIPDDGTIPVMTYRTKGISGDIAVDWEDFRTISLYLPGLSGHSEFAFYLKASSAQIELDTFTTGEATRLENAPDPDAYELTPYEIATYISYTITGSTPDSFLLAAADEGKLSTDEQIAAQIERLLNTPRATARLGNFAAQWMGTDLALTQPKDMNLFPELNGNIRQSMAQEVRELFVHSAIKGNSFAEFFNTESAFVDNTLGQFYGLSGGKGSKFTMVPGGDERGGITTTGAFHVAYGNFEGSSPIIRAARVREKLLCQEIPPPPAGIAIDRAAAEERIAEIIKGGGSVTQRDRTELLTDVKYCAQCHEKIINPLGFGMEDYDTIGRFQSSDINDNTIDASGIIYGVESFKDLNSTSVSFYGGKGLGTVLAKTESAYECFVENAFRFATGTGATKIDPNNPDIGLLTAQEKEDYACSIHGITETLIKSGYNAKEVFKSLGTMKLVRYRKELNR